MPNGFDFHAAPLWSGGLEYPPRQIDIALAASASQFGLAANRARDT
jgi:hypothetical protein